MMSPKNKKKRVIRVKDPQLRRFRTSMRELLKEMHSSERGRLYDQIVLIRNDEALDIGTKIKEKDIIRKQIGELDRARFHAPIGCCICGRQDLDLVFNPYGSEWYCESCYAFNQDYYKKNPHPYEPDWRKLYP